MNPLPTAALFDIGNVLVHLDFEGALRKLIPPDAEDHRLRLASLLEIKDDLESGRTPVDHFIRWASERLGFSGPADEFRLAWNSIFQPIHAMWSVASFLKARGLKMILFSNTNSMHADWLLDNFDVFAEFDARVFSHEVGSSKPEPAIYHHAIQTHNLTPADTLYIDDLPENIAQGRKFGFRCHQYSFPNHHQFVAWLDAQLGTP